MPKTRNCEHNEYKQLAKWFKKSFPLQPFDINFFHQIHLMNMYLHKGKHDFVLKRLKSFASQFYALFYKTYNMDNCHLKSISPGFKKKITQYPIY